MKQSQRLKEFLLSTVWVTYTEKWWGAASSRGDVPHPTHTSRLPAPVSTEMWGLRPMNTCSFVNCLLRVSEKSAVLHQVFLFYNDLEGWAPSNPKGQGHEGDSSLRREEKGRALGTWEPRISRMNLKKNPDQPEPWPSCLGTEASVQTGCFCLEGEGAWGFPLLPRSCLYPFQRETNKAQKRQILGPKSH